ncbi:MAG: MBL fold metallo-hydrolase [Hyphomicrobiales bacterium]|nr:MBL fold metallo-hydrolase [Hyphomicrobiales bacterium]
MTDDSSDEKLVHSTAFDVKSDQVQQISPLVRRLVENNPGPFTFTGTCTYIVGRGDVAIIDPGRENEAHLEAILRALEGERVAQIVITHTHKDHSPGARQLAERTGAPVVGCAPFARKNAAESGLDSAHDLTYAPSRVLKEGDSIEGDGWSLVAVETPGHASNHLAFALPQERALFSGDHVMAWSTSIVAPPDGNMTEYMASLDKLREHDHALYWPGHGGPVMEPQRYVRALKSHRRQREAAIVRRLEAGDHTIPEMVARIYENLDPRLVNAAALSVLAHIEDLVTRGVAIADGPITTSGRYRLA